MPPRKKLATLPDGGWREALRGAAGSVGLALLAVARAVAGTLTSPGFILLALLAGAGGLLVAGVHILAGLGWALIAGAASLFALALFMARGLSGG